jgi:hypothetical protein
MPTCPRPAVIAIQPVSPRYNAPIGTPGCRRALRARAALTEGRLSGLRTFPARLGGDLPQDRFQTS